MEGDPQLSGSHWWNDYSENLPSGASLSEQTKPQNEKASVPDPGWILDSLTDDKPVESLRFQGPPKETRIIIVGSMVLVALTRFFVEMPASEFLVIVTGVCGLNLLLCFVLYKRDASQAEFEQYKNEYQDFLRTIREHQSVVDAISAERLTVQTKLDEGERRIAGQKSHLSATLQTDLNAAQLELDARFQAIVQRRREISTSETNKLNSLQAVLGSQVSELDRKISYLKQNEAAEKHSALNALQLSHVQIYLRSHSILSSWIPGIGEAYRSRLYYSGLPSNPGISCGDRLKKLANNSTKNRSSVFGDEFSSRRSAEFSGRR